MSRLVRDRVRLAYEECGRGEPAMVLVHGLACHRGFWAAQVEHFARRHRVVAVDLRGHGESGAPVQPYTIPGFADDIAWLCAQLGIQRPVIVGHSLGGLVALELGHAGGGAGASAGTSAGARDGAGAGLAAGVVMVDSVLVPSGDRAEVVDTLVAGLRGEHPERVLRDYFALFFGPHDDPRRMDWVLGEAVRTPPHVTSSTWEESLRSWDDAEALRRCAVPLLYLDAGTPNADLQRAATLTPGLIVGRTVGSGHFSPLEVPDQVNAMVDRFLATSLPR